MSEKKINRRDKKYQGQLHGGRKDTCIDYLMGTDDLAGREGMFARVRVDEGGSIGFHEHKGETETYYILSGEGVYYDGEKRYLVKPGEVYFCESGKGHSIENTGKGFLELVALILPL